MSDEIPSIEVHVRGLKQTIAAAVMVRDDQFRERIDEGIDRAIRELDFRSVIELAVADHFKRAVQTVLWDVFRADDTQEAVRTAVFRSLAALGKPAKTPRRKR